jgi:hypothetical protein
MTHQERETIINALIEEAKLTRDTKGKDYAGDTDVNFNFKDLGKDLNLTPEQVLLVYLKKHISRITNTIRDNPSNPIPHGETLRESIKDSINFLFILESLLIERKPTYQIYTAPDETFKEQLESYYGDDK